MFNIIRAIYTFVKFNPFFVSFFSAMISEELVIFLSILSGKGEILLLLVFLGALTGSFIADQIYFYVGKANIIHKIKNHHKCKNTIEKLPGFIKRIGERNIFLEIFVTKFIYGTRAAAVISISHKKIPYRKFIISDFFAIFCWALIIVPAGYLAGRGITFFLLFFKGLERFLLIALLLLIIYFLVVKTVINKFYRTNC
jgi:membrane protein DedA with SNARE-associated domain